MQRQEKLKIFEDVESMKHHVTAIDWQLEIMMCNI